MSVDSSRQTSVSQEDTTPAVPKSHVRIRIRVLETNEQIVASNDYEREALELLEKQSFRHVKIFEPLFLIKTGLKQDMNKAFTYTGWEDFADIIEAVVHWRADMRLCSSPELQCLFAMAHKDQAGPSQPHPQEKTSQQAGPYTTHMSLEDTYEHYTHGGSTAAGGSTWYCPEQGFNYPPGMQSSYGPQVGPSTFARYGYDNPIMRGIVNLTTRVDALGQQQDKISQDLAHNTDLMQQNWGMTMSMHYDIAGVFSHLGLGPNQQQHYYPDQQ
ncbi:hypothetical protein C2845_PM16G03020 [Panicum miliaceum]|uniref:Uncharacterized protein n=1 Tax=Panicum miliaceum TaxID=4540 RepID=A0A3L6PWF0_PANMI|nr:hypothetical protein C2845_PM16G03020 [Panicum miliaceum]